MPKVAPHVTFARLAAPKASKKCAICSDPRIKGIMADWVAEWKAGRSRMTYPEATAYLREHHGYAYGVSAVSRCIREDFGHAAR